MEIIVAIAILVVLLGIVIVAINPSRQFSLANNTKRRSDIVAILNAVHQYSSDNKGFLGLIIKKYPRQQNINISAPCGA